MSLPRINLCSVLIRDQFGDVVEKVFILLLKKGATGVSIIAHQTCLKLSQVKQALCTLIQHHLVSFELNKRGLVEYVAKEDVALARTRFPQYVYAAKTLYGDTAELITEELIHHGQRTMSEVVYSVTDRLNETLQGSTRSKITVYQVRDTFEKLTQTQFVKRCQGVESPAQPGDIPHFCSEEEATLYTLPKVKLHDDTKKRKLSTGGTDGPPSKRARKEKCAGLSDDGIYWKVSYERFDRHLRDQLLISAISRKIDARCGEVFRSLLRISEVTSDVTAPATNPLSSHEIFQGVPKELGLSKQLIEQYLRILIEDKIDFLQKVGESGGGMYQINFLKALTTLCHAHIESVVQERFGSKSLRIFRLLMLKKQAEQKQIEEFAMVKAKEAKELLYTMFGEHFVSLTEVSKTPDHAPSRTFYLFSVKTTQVTRMLLERCYKTMYNLRLRENQELADNKRLLDKQQRMETIVASLEQTGADDMQKHEIEEMITPAEKAQVTRIRNNVKKLTQGELQLDDTILVLQMYLHYCQLK